MSTSNGINSDSFSRSDVIKTYQVVQYFGGILTQYPIVYNVNLEYNTTTGIITANGITSFQATSGTTQTPLNLRGANSNSATRPGANVTIASGNGFQGSNGGTVLISSGGNGNFPSASSSSILMDVGGVNITESVSGTSLSISEGGVDFVGGNRDGSLGFTAGQNTAQTQGWPIYFQGSNNKFFEMQEDTGSIPKIGFFGKTPLSAKPEITGSRGGNVALNNLLTALAALGLITNSTT